MAGNTPNVSRDSFDQTKNFDRVSIQQGVPVLDSDLNEAQDNLIAQTMKYLRATKGTKLLPSIDGDTFGFSPKPLGSTISDFTIQGGGAVVGGAFVGTPNLADSSYNSLENYLFKGIITAIGANTVQDNHKEFQSNHYLTSCRLLMVSGAESGNTFSISGLNSAIELQLASSAGSIAPGDEYIILPNILSGSYGSPTTLYVNLMVFWEDVNSIEDPDMLNPGVGIETAHRRQRRWCIRTDLSALLVEDPAMTFGIQIYPIAVFEIPAGATEFTEEMVVLNPSYLDYTLKGAMGIVAEPFVYRTELTAGTSVDLPQVWDDDDPANGIMPDVQYYAGKSFQGMAFTNYAYFKFFKYEAGRYIPLYGTDGHLITLAQTQLDDIPVTPNNEVDDYGFLPAQKVTLFLSFGLTADSSYTGNLLVMGYRRKYRALRQDRAVVAPEVAALMATEHTHAERVKVPEIIAGAAIPTDLIASNFLPETLRQVMKMINHKIDSKQQPDTGSVNWVPVWSSHNGLADEDSVGIYYRNGHLALVRNGVMGSSGVITPGDSAEPVEAIDWTDRINHMHCVNPGVDPLSITSPANWDLYNDTAAIPTSFNRRVTSALNQFYENWVLVDDSSRNANSIRRVYGFGASVQELFGDEDQITMFYGGLGISSFHSGTGPSSEDLEKIVPMKFDISGLSFSDLGAGNYSAACDISIPAIRWNNNVEDLACIQSFVLNRVSASGAVFCQSCHVGLQSTGTPGTAGNYLAIRQIVVPQALFNSDFSKLVIWVSLEGEMSYPS